MKKSIYFLFFSFLTVNLFCQSGDTKKDLQITYIANEGFLISSGNTKILIDGLFKSKHYTSPSDSLISMLTGNKPPVDKINYVFVTHDHQDHFDPKLVSEFLLKNPDSKFISTSESCKMLTDEKINSSNLVCLNLEIGEMKEISEIINDNLSVSAFRLKHGTSTDINNLAYLIRINDFNIMHMGDAFILQNQEYLENLNWDKYNIDVLFIGYMDANNFVLESLSKTIKPKNLILMHIHSDDIQEAKDRNEKCGANAIIFEKELETETFTK